MLANTAIYLPYLTKLDFSRNKMIEPELLGTAICKHKKLKWLDVTSIGYSDQGLALFVIKLLKDS